MSGKVVVFTLLLLLSVAVGVGLGEWFHRLHVSAIPPVGQSQFNTRASHVAYLLYGACVGLVLFVWSLIGMGINGILGKFPKQQATNH